MTDASSNPTLRCSFVGLGAMGEPMARHLAARGLLAAVWNRTSAKAQALAAELDVAAPAALSDVALLSDLVFVFFEQLRFDDGEVAFNSRLTVDLQLTPEQRSRVFGGN